jgi:hypothetical protein
MVIRAHLSSLVSEINVTLVIQNPWYIVALLSFTTGNRPDAVPLLFKYVLEELERVQNRFGVSEVEANREKLLLARRFRDAIFKGGMISGYSKVYTLPLLSWTNQRCNKLPLGYKRPDLSSRGYARGTTRCGTTEVSDRVNTDDLGDGPAEKLPYRYPRSKSAARYSSDNIMVKLQTACRVCSIRYTRIWVRTPRYLNTQSRF